VKSVIKTCQDDPEAYARFALTHLTNPNLVIRRIAIDLLNGSLRIRPGTFLGVTNPEWGVDPQHLTERLYSTEGAVQGLLDALEDSDSDVRESAVQIVDKMNCTSAVPRLFKSIISGRSTKWKSTVK
jgi:HEAT repeat protein